MPASQPHIADFPPSYGNADANCVLEPYTTADDSPNFNADCALCAIDGNAGVASQITEFSRDGSADGTRTLEPYAIADNSPRFNADGALRAIDDNAGVASHVADAPPLTAAPTPTLLSSP